MTADDADKAAQTARDDLEAARVEVMDNEKKIKTIKDTLRRVSIEQDKPNALTIAALRVSDLPPSAQPSFHLQLSSPIEELTLSKLYDPSDPSGTSATFNGVESSMAMITVKAKDGDCHLGSSGSHEVTPWCAIKDALQPLTTTSMEVEIQIFPDEESGYTTATTAVEEAKDEAVAVEKTEAAAADETKEPVATTEEEKDEGKEDECPETVIVEEKDAIEESTETTKEEGGATPEEETPAETTTTDGGEADDKADDDKAEETPKEDSTTDEPKVESSTETESKTDDTTPSSPPPSTETTTTPKDDPPTTTTTTPDSKPAITDTTIPVCTITFKITFKPSPKDQKDALYDLLNKTSKTKAIAMEKLRQSAIAVSRTQQRSGPTPSASNPAVKAGFLNDDKQKSKKTTTGMMGRLKGFYERTLGPQSLIRVLFPIVKNYGLFLGVVVMMHYRGQELALPPPV